MFGISRHCCLLLTENVPRGVLFTKANRVIKLYVPRVNTQNGYRTHTHNHSEPPNVNNAHYAYATLRWCSACFVAYTYVLPTLTFLSLSLSLSADTRTCTTIRLRPLIWSTVTWFWTYCLMLAWLARFCKRECSTRMSIGAIICTYLAITARRDRLPT